MTGTLGNLLNALIVWAPPLASGVLVTLGLLFCSAALTLVLSIAVGLARLSPFLPLRATAFVYVEILRGVSLYVTLFWLYFALPFLGVTLSPWGAAVLALGMVHGAYASEYVKSTITAVSAAQAEAAIALSMSRWQSLRYVIAPQALAVLMPLYGNEMLLLLKSTSVASLISVADLTEQGRSIMVTTYQTVPSLLSVLILYFILAQILTRALRSLEAYLVRWRPVPNLLRTGGLQPA